MNARYLGKRIKKDKFGDVTSALSPCVLVTMKESEEDRFIQMMKWINQQCGDASYDYDLFIDDNVESAYVYVDDGADGADFLHFYKQAKKFVK